jgi:hypothetical protein
MLLSNAGFVIDLVTASHNQQQQTAPAQVALMHTRSLQEGSAKIDW